MTTARAFAAAALVASALALAPTASAAPDDVNLTDVPDIDSLPVCTQEDCSDQQGQVGVWLDRGTGDWYLERGEGYTRRIVDDTAVLS